MSTLQQLCPHCARTLELPDSSRGRLAQCPACETNFRVGQQESEAAEADNTQPPDPENTETKNTEPTTAGSPPRVLVITEVPIEEVLSVTLSIFAARWKSLILSSLLLAFVGLVVCGVIALLLAFVVSQTALYVLHTLLVLFFFCTLPIAVLGSCRVQLAVARDEPSPLKKVLTPIQMIQRFLPSYVSLAMCIFLAAGLVAAMVFAANRAGQFNLAVMIGIVGSFALCIAYSAMNWYFWATIMIASDEQNMDSAVEFNDGEIHSGLLGQLRIAREITARNQLTALFISIITIVLFLAGTAVFFVGHIVTLPLTLLLFAVAYLMMTGQPIADPSNSDYRPDWHREQEFHDQDESLDDIGGDEPA